MPLLKDIHPGETVRVGKINGTGALRQHFLDMGIIPGIEMTVVQLAPMGDPMELRLRGYELTLRLEDAGEIEVSPVGEKKEPIHAKVTRTVKEHPGLGEGGRHHPKGSGDPLPDGTVMKFALVGNQNSGKTYKACS